MFNRSFMILLIIISSATLVSCVGAKRFTLHSKTMSNTGIRMDGYYSSSQNISQCLPFIFYSNGVAYTSGGFENCEKFEQYLSELSKKPKGLKNFHLPITDWGVYTIQGKEILIQLRHSEDPPLKGVHIVGENFK